MQEMRRLWDTKGRRIYIKVPKELERDMILIPLCLPIRSVGKSYFPEIVFSLRFLLEHWPFRNFSHSCQRFR